MKKLKKKKKLGVLTKEQKVQAALDNARLDCSEKHRSLHDVEACEAGVDRIERELPGFDPENTRERVALFQHAEDTCRLKYANEDTNRYSLCVKAANRVIAAIGKAVRKN